jgi:hypothetical protein
MWFFSIYQGGHAHLCTLKLVFCNSVTAKAGHAGITVDENWYMVGDGGNISGI